MRPSPRRAIPARRSIIAGVSGIALAASGVALTGGAAAADPDGEGTAAPEVLSAAEHSVTLITGDRVRVSTLSDGTSTVDVETAVEGAGYQTITVGDDILVVPDAASAYIAKGALDRDLFNVTQLIEFGYDDASVDATPIIVEHGSARRSAPPVGIKTETALPSIDASAATASHSDAAATWAALTGSPAAGARSFHPGGAFSSGIEAIHLDGKVRATLDSSVPWTGTPEAWDAGYTGEGVTVAVLDTGYDDTHPDLADRVLPESASFVPGEEVDVDTQGHGTHVAATIAGTGAASDGQHRGVADGSDLLVGKVLDKDGFGQDSWIIAGMEWAAERAPIVSMSLGSQQPSDGKDLMATALNNLAAETGSLFVVAAGNSTNPETIGSPGSAASALTVGSVDDPTGALSWFSSQGPLARSGALKPDLAAPGNEITAARSADSAGSGDYVTMSGTSMATPHVAGAAAIVKQQHPDYTAAQLRAALVSTATDVGLTAYQVGAGALDVAGAVEDTVLASGSGDFGTLLWGAEPTPVVREIEYTNRSQSEVTVSLDVSLADTTPGGGGGAAEGIVSLDAPTLTIPAGETRTATLTADPGDVPAGAQYSGTLIASVEGTEVARTALGIIAEAERYDLTVTATGLDGEPADTVGWIHNVETGWYTSIPVSGETTLRLAAGTYSLMSMMPVHSAPDSEGIALVGDPHIELDGATSVAFDARDTERVTVDVDEDGVESSYRRLDYVAAGFMGSATVPVWTDELYAQPLEAGDADQFSFTARWRLQHPTLSVNAGKLDLDVIAQPGGTLLDGDVSGHAVDIGTGTAEEVAAADVKRKVAVATVSDAVAPSSIAANAAAKGAALLILVNGDPAETSVWVGSDDGATPSPIAVAGISGVQGAELREQMAKKRVLIKATGIPVSDETWDVALYSDGSIPADLSYKPQLARIDTQYIGRDGELVGEFRYDFAPNAPTASGFLQRVDRGMERTEWVSTDDFRWYQTATLVGAAWDMRDTMRSYKPGQRVDTSWFGAVVRPYVGPEFWAPYRSGDAVQINVPSAADGANPERTGTVDTFAEVPGTSYLGELFVDGEPFASSPYQGSYAWGIPDGESTLRYVLTTTQDGTWLPTSTKTLTEWSMGSSGKASENDKQLLPMMQASYDVALSSGGIAGVKRKKNAPIEVGIDVGHVSGAVGSAAVKDVTVEVRTDGGEWERIELDLESRDDSGPGEPPSDGFADGRAYVAAYTATVPVPNSGGFIDLRVTAVDEAGNTFSQEIERAVQVAPARGAKG
ncbi:S8 family serine peptidase [Microbacterium sp.]|uniref:S8 family peptidase n=1 Tax=Microbacterium sp. TaxID=51671 RepID=UPI0028114A0C|nr:S8 family serine peptidase [Microbacterium sp.]